MARAKEVQTEKYTCGDVCIHLDQRPKEGLAYQVLVLFFPCLRSLREVDD